jgi:hypothetical protein
LDFAAAQLTGEKLAIEKANTTAKSKTINFFIFLSSLKLKSIIIS